MSIRVTQQNMYKTMVGQMQKNLGNYMESVEQGSSQKKINRPSDDPAGTYRVLTTRVDMTSTAQYQENVDTAKGWLNLADDVLSNRVTTAITGLKTLAEQASTGTYDAAQRKIMAEQAKQYFGQLLNLSNTDFEGKSIFAGHKYDGTAFEQGLAITSWDNELLADKNSETYYKKDENGEVIKDDNGKPVIDNEKYQKELEGTFNYLVSQGQAKVVGASESSMMVQFLAEGTDENGNSTGIKNATYRWSNDGGETWNEGTVTGPKNGKYTMQLDPNGAYIELNEYRLGHDGKELTYEQKMDANGPMVDADGNPVLARDKNGNLIPDPNGVYAKNEWSIVPGTTGNKDADSSKDLSAGARNGTTLYLRPAAFYQGDDKDPPVEVTALGPNLTAANVDANGTFGKNIMVRVDGEWDSVMGEYKNVDLFQTNPPAEFTYSYSTDGGANWVTAKASTTGEGSVRLPIPGGYIDFKADSITAGSQALVHPSRADLDYEIMKDTYLSVNGVGKDIFGGYYEGKPAIEGDANLFEVVGAFIGYLEFNNQEGCQRTLAALTTAEKTVLHEATRVGGMENRIEMASDVLAAQKIDQQERLSYVEDIDLTELLTKLTRQQLTYQTVLQSSSMIMQMSLANYV